MPTILHFLKELFPPACHDHIFLVGGTPRDILQGREHSDTDLVAAVAADELISLGFRQVEASSGAVMYFKHHPLYGNIEATLINSVDDLEDDLRQRDFTINAMAMDLNGNLIDPLGSKNDAASGTLRTCSRNSFTDDPLRILRAFRFEADGWNMTQDVVTLIKGEDWSVCFSTMPVERFTLEMLKALTLKAPHIFFQRMIEFNIGSEFIPELFRMPHIPAGPLQHHPEGDLFSHAIEVLQRVAATSSDPLARFCALFHDLGKLATDPALYPKHHGHDHAGFALAVDFCNRLRLSVVHRTALAWVCSLHGKANLWETLRDATKLTMAEQAVRAGIVEILPLVAAADKVGNPPMTGWRETVRIAELSSRELGIDQEKLGAMPVKNRPSYILQKRIELFNLIKAFETRSN